MSEKKQVALVRNVKNNQIYEWKGGNNFANLSTGKEGEIKTEDAQKYFVIPVGINQVCNEYPLVYALIKQLQLNCDKSIIE